MGKDEKKGVSYAWSVLRAVLLTFLLMIFTYLENE